jgi:hypothetical protein
MRQLRINYDNTTDEKAFDQAVLAYIIKTGPVCVSRHANCSIVKSLDDDSVLGGWVQMSVKRSPYIYVDEFRGYIHE